MRVVLTLPPALVVLVSSIACGPSLGSQEDLSTTDAADDSHGSATGGLDDADDDGRAESSDPATSDPGADESGTGGDPPGLGEPIASGERFVDAFFTDDGLLIVEAERALFVSRTSDMVLSYASPRTIKAAAFADDLLVLADDAKLTTLDAAFATVVSANLTEGCASATLLGEHRFVCGPENDWDRIFYTYDALDGTLLAQSQPNTYHGIPMRGVPGFDEFVTVSDDISPSDFHLYALDTMTNEAVFVNESPYHGDFGVNRNYAFVGMPATHVVTHQGVMLRIHDEGCAPGSPFESQCFVKDGELGTLPTDASYADLRESADGTLYGLVTDWSTQNPCAPDACTLQRIDAQERVVIASTLVSTVQPYVFVRPDPTTPAVAVITSAFGNGYGEGTAYDVWYVTL